MKRKHKHWVSRREKREGARRLLDVTFYTRFQRQRGRDAKRRAYIQAKFDALSEAVARMLEPLHPSHFRGDPPGFKDGVPLMPDGSWLAGTFHGLPIYARRLSTAINADYDARIFDPQEPDLFPEVHDLSAFYDMVAAPRTTP